MPALTPIRLVAIAKLALVVDVDEVTTGQATALSEDRRQAIVDLLQDREVLQAHIRELKREDEGFIRL